jgi:hypothetical protein
MSMKHTQQIFVALILAGLAYAAQIVGSTGAQNVLGFASGVLCVLVFMAALSNSTAAISARRPPAPSWVRGISGLINFGTVSFLIWHGAWATGIALFFAILLTMAIQKEADQIRSANTSSVKDGA